MNPQKSPPEPLHNPTDSMNPIHSKPPLFPSQVEGSSPSHPGFPLDLESTLRSLSISPKEEVQVELEDYDEDLVFSDFNLLLKVGSPFSPPTRIISFQTFQAAMKAAWSHRYFKSTQIAPNLFMAHFKLFEDLQWVWQKQPWSVDRETILMEWIDPSHQTPFESYTFRYLPVTIRLYGVPQNFCDSESISKLLDKIGAIHDSASFSQIFMFKQAEYVSARVMIDVSKILLDSLTISTASGKSCKVYLHYEKIHKICNFCGFMFHVVAGCPQRQEILWRLKNNPREVAKVPLEIYGRWRTQASEIPQDAFDEVRGPSKNPFIQSFRKFFQGPSDHNSTGSSLHTAVPSSAASAGQSSQQSMQLKCPSQPSSKESTEALVVQPMQTDLSSTSQRDYSQNQDSFVMQKDMCLTGERREASSTSHTESPNVVEKVKEIRSPFHGVMSGPLPHSSGGPSSHSFSHCSFSNQGYPIVYNVQEHSSTLNTQQHAHTSTHRFESTDSQYVQPPRYPISSFSRPNKRHGSPLHQPASKKPTASLLGSPPGPSAFFRSPSPLPSHSANRSSPPIADQSDNQRARRHGPLVSKWDCGPATGYNGDRRDFKESRQHGVLCDTSPDSSNLDHLRSEVTSHTSSDNVSLDGAAAPALKAPRAP